MQRIEATSTMIPQNYSEKTGQSLCIKCGNNGLATPENP
jgi:hypothetical protein